METSPTLYLIAHKVRGEPAFDIAYQMMFGSEEGWLIPTSGHRAYPYWHFSLDALKSYVPGDEFMWGPGPMPEGLRDHYETHAAPKGTGLHSASDLAAALGLRKAPNITRRI